MWYFESKLYLIRINRYISHGYEEKSFPWSFTAHLQTVSFCAQALVSCQSSIFSWLLIKTLKYKSKLQILTWQMAAWASELSTNITPNINFHLQTCFHVWLISKSNVRPADIWAASEPRPSGPAHKQEPNSHKYVLYVQPRTTVDVVVWLVSYLSAYTCNIMYDLFATHVSNSTSHVFVSQIYYFPSHL